MSKTASRGWLGGLAATVALLCAGCMAGQTATPPASTSTGAPTSAPTTASPTPGGSDPAEAGPRLIVLADGVDAGLGLWAIDMQGHWTTLGSTPGATALGRTTGGVAVATAHQIDVRPASDLTQPGAKIELRWIGAEPTAPVTALDGSPAGELAFVTSDANSLGYGVADDAGSVAELVPAPTQSFTPLVSWLDSTRLLVLSTDNQQQSRLATVDSTAHTLEPAMAFVGVTAFGLSSDRKTIAAAMGNGVYAGPLAAYMGHAAPQQVMALGDLQIVWAVAADTDGSSVFMLSGTVEPDGKVTSIRELGFSKHGSTWTKVLDSPAPFSRAIAQVYLPA